MNLDQNLILQPSQEVQLPNLNSSKSNLASKGAQRRSIKNRRNISIKQSWDKPNFKKDENPLSGRQNSKSKIKQPSPQKFYQKVQGRHNVNSNLKFNPPGYEMSSPSHKAIEPMESPTKRNIPTDSDYYGSYAKIAE